MASTPIARFEPDSDRFAVIRGCTDNFDVGDSTAEWPNNILSRRAVVYGSGQITRAGESVRHAVDPDELDLCRRLAAEAEEMMGGALVGMGSVSDTTDDVFRGFYIVGTVDDPAPGGIDGDLIRSRFGGVIFPLATITVEPLVEAGEWWSEVVGPDDEDGPDCFPSKRATIRWFRGQPEFVASAFVRIGDREALRRVPRGEWPAGTRNTGCVLPRLALGLTRGGSLVGLFGHTVQPD